MQKDIERIAERFGMEHQKLKTIEELKELIEAIENLSNDFSVDNYENVVEEIADVENMLDQYKYFYEIAEEHLKEVKQEKIERTIERYGVK